MTIADFIATRIRPLVNDVLTSTLQKVSDTQMLYWVQDFLRELAADCQEAFMDATGALQTYAPACLVTGDGSGKAGTYVWGSDGKYHAGAFYIEFVTDHWRLTDGTHIYYYTSGGSLTTGWTVGADGTGPAPTVVFTVLTGTFNPDAVTAATAWPVDTMYMAPAAEFVANKYFSSDSAGTRNETLAAEHLRNYQKWFAAVGR